MKYALFSLALLLQSICVSASPPYTITQYVEISKYYTSVVTPSGSPTNILSTITDTTSYPQVTILQLVLPRGSIPTSTYHYNASYTYTTPIQTNYLVPITYVPSASCSQTWKHSTNVLIYIPTILQAVITPAAVSTSTLKLPSAWSTTYTDIIALLNPTDVPSNLISAASYSRKPYDLTSCAKPTSICYTATATSFVGGKETSCYVSFHSDSDGVSKKGSYSSPADKEFNEWLRKVILIVVLVPVIWSVVFLIVGFIECWHAFKGLMLGKRRKRGTPYAWGCISWLFLCCVGPTYKAKSLEEQEILKGRWMEMGSGEKLRLFVKWGFKWRYPDMLGSEPEVEKKAFRTRVCGI